MTLVLKFLVCRLKNPFLSNDVVGLFQNLLVMGSSPVFLTSPGIMKIITWDVVWDLEVDLVGFGVLSNVLLSEVINLRELGALLLDGDIEDGIFVGEVGMSIVYLLAVEDIILVGRYLGVPLLVLRVNIVPHCYKYYGSQLVISSIALSNNNN